MSCLHMCDNIGSISLIYNQYTSCLLLSRNYNLLFEFTSNNVLFIVFFLLLFH